MKNLIIISIFVFIFTGCAGGSRIDYQKASTNTGINQKLLKEACNGITCIYDELKDKVQVTANDSNAFLELSGSDTRGIEFTWVSGNKLVAADVFDSFTEKDWRFHEYAEIYVDKEMVAKLDGVVDRLLGQWDTFFSTHRKTEQVSGSLTIKQAEKIAAAPYESVTIRFYGKQGYTDSKLKRAHKLSQVVKLAMLKN